SQNQPLPACSFRAGSQPIPEKKGSHERRKSMRPGGVEIHVNGQGGGKPNTNGGPKSPAFVNEPSRDEKRDAQARESVECRGYRHHHHVRTRLSIGREMRAQTIQCQDYEMRAYYEWTPEDGRTDRVIVGRITRPANGIHPNVVHHDPLDL